MFSHFLELSPCVRRNMVYGGNARPSLISERRFLPRLAARNGRTVKEATMEFFTAIPEGQAVIYSNGVYRQTSLFMRGDLVYAKYGSGFIRLSQGGSTSHPKFRWADIYTPNGEWFESGGFVRYAAHQGAE